VIITLCALAALAQTPVDEDPRVQALIAELDREVAELTLPDAPPIYHARYHLITLDQVDAHASLGGLVETGSSPAAALGFELRVGDPMYDNTGFGGWQNGFGSAWLPRQVTPEALTLEAWRLSDDSYKQAVEQHARKVAQFSPPEDYPGDYTLMPPQRHDGGAATAAPAGPLTAMVRSLSSVFPADPRVERGEVYLGHEAGAHVIVDTDGSLVRRPMAETTIRAVIHVRAHDGLLLTDQRLWSVRDPADLPDEAALADEIRGMAADLLAAADAPVLTEEYVGPVVFEDGAALDLFRWLLVEQIEGTPDEIPFDSFFGDLGATSGSVRLGRRVLPLGWSASDDPTAVPDHPSSFTYDAEGTPAQAVDLITDGIVRTALMSRIPRSDIEASNGHARGGPGSRLSGRATQLLVEPDRHLSTAKLLKKALKLSASYGRDHVIVVRRLQEPAVLDLDPSGGFFFFGGSDGSDGALPPPVALVRVYADGREELVRGAAFAGVHRFVLRDLAAAGPQHVGTFMAPGNPGGMTSSPTEGMATWISAPSVLVGELEIVPQSGNPRDVPVLVRPDATAP
jgi:TldD protein